MKFTGERPTLEHEIRSSRIRYKNVIPYCIESHVLDFGCGVGQGTSFLSQFVPSVVGYELDPEALREARETFTRPGCRFVGPELDVFYKELENVDIVASVEVIEHIEKEDLNHFLARIPKHLDFVCTTPNGDLFPYHPQTLQDRVGFHVWHYMYQELLELFGQHFGFVEVSGHAYDPALARFTGYTVFASNKIKKVTDEMLEKAILE